MTLPLLWTVSPAPGRTLILVFAYHGRDRDRPTPSRLQRLEGAGSHGHLIVHRDHYANPRTAAYQMALVAAAVPVLCGDAPPDLVIDTALGDVGGLPDGAERADLAAPRFWRDGLAARARGYQNVVLVYPDALGLGCERAERRLLRECGSVLVMNGRRRVFRLDESAWSDMDVHRWLARTRAVERLLAVLIRPAGRVLAAWDRMAGRAA